MRKPDLYGICSMKVAQGAVELCKCPYFSEDALATLSEATAPPMKTIKVGTGEAEYSLWAARPFCAVMRKLS